MKMKKPKIGGKIGLGLTLLDLGYNLGKEFAGKLSKTKPKKIIKKAAQGAGAIAGGAALGSLVPDGPIDKKNKRLMEEKKQQKKNKKKKVIKYPPPKNKKKAKKKVAVKKKKVIKYPPPKRK